MNLNMSAKIMKSLDKQKLGRKAGGSDFLSYVFFVVYFINILSYRNVTTITYLHKGGNFKITIIF